MTGPRGRSPWRAALAGLVVFGVSVLVLGWVVRVVMARSELAPAGPTCSYEVDEGSGAAGYGTERVDWGLWPSRVCVTDSGVAFRGGAVDSTSPLQPDLFEMENAPWWIGTVCVVLALSAVVGVLVARSVHRRSSAPVRDRPTPDEGSGSAVTPPE